VASKRKVDFSERMAATKAALYLELVAAGLRRGSASLNPRNLGEEYQLPTEVDLGLRLRLRPKRSRGRLTLELTWSLPEAIPADDNPPGST
jgi:hypothetical protein